MNPLRKIFLGLSRMPPALMLLIIIGLATLVTMMVTGRVSKLEAERELKRGNGTMSAVIVSTCKIPAQSEIKRSMIAKKRVQEVSIWQDSMTTIPNVVGRTSAKDIPANVQIREADLNY